MEPRSAHFFLGLSTGIAMCSGLFSLYTGWLLAQTPYLEPAAGKYLADSPQLADDDGIPPAEAMARLSEMYALSTDKLNQIVRLFVVEMKKGLAADGQSLLMIPSHVTSLPTGREHGSYLVLDLHAAMLRVAEVVLDGHSNARSRQKTFTISQKHKTLPRDELFDYLAECLAEFIHDDESDSVVSSPPLERPSLFKLSFTFSFPSTQKSLDAGSLILWTKGFANPGVVGEDVVQLLRAALVRKGIANIVEIVALANGTTTNLVGHAYTQPSTLAGVIVGTGTNCAYVESVENITKLDRRTLKNKDAKDMVVNVEWGGFDDGEVIIPRNKYDVKVDRSSKEVGKRTFEKMISGMYLGEIVRFALMDLTKTGDIFRAGGSPELQKANSFETSFMARIERDHSLDLGDTRTVLEGMLKIPHTTLADRRLVKSLCELVGKRSARLTAAAVAAIVTKMNKLDGCTVAIGGSLFESYPHYSNRMRDAMQEIFGITAEYVVLEQIGNVIGQGGAVVAALAGHS
ncbi:hexokinase A [Entophlyctis luteolus]|nr:hexokinase A [Entophlyctis luteolus]